MFCRMTFLVYVYCSYGSIMSRCHYACPYCKIDLSKIESVGRHIHSYHTKELLANIKDRMEKMEIARSTRTPTFIILDGYKSVYKCLGCPHISIQEKAHVEHTNKCEMHQKRITMIVNDISEELAKKELIELNERYMALEKEMLALTNENERLKSERLYYKNEHERLYDENEDLCEERDVLNEEHEILHKENKCLSRKVELLQEENNKMKTAKPKRPVSIKTTDESVEITYM